MTPEEWSRIQQGIFAGESGGDYGALFNYQNRDNGRFSDVNLTGMTVDQALDFASPSGPYGQYVKSQVGRVATPMGAYQVVGTTLRAAKNALGLTGNEVMTPEMQDQIGQWIYRTQGTGAWEGYKPLTDAQAVGAETMAALGKTPMQGRAGTQGEAPMMQEEQQPRGLLGTLGIQKMEEGAPGEAGQRFYERDTFKDTAAVMAEAFAGLGSNPTLQKAAAGIASQRTEAKARNKTVEYLRANGRGDLADMIEQGMISGKDAAGVMLAKPDVTKGVAVGDRIVNPITGEVIYEGAPTLDQDKVLAARKEFTSLPVVKAFSDQTTAYGRVISSVQDPSPAGDLALIFNYMKVLDPGSVVREGEFATAQNAGSVDDRTRGLYNRIMSGERLSEAQRADFADRATRLYSGAEQQYQDISEQYGAFARSAGLPPDQVIPNFGFTGDRYKKPLSMTPPPAPAGVDAATWPSVWAEMTDEERAAYQ